MTETHLVYPRYHEKKRLSLALSKVNGLLHQCLLKEEESLNQYLFKVPDVKTCTYGQRSFSFYATKLWNDLPFYIKQSESIAIFKKNLKTFLFCNSY